MRLWPDLTHPHPSLAALFTQASTGSSGGLNYLQGPDPHSSHHHQHHHHHGSQDGGGDDGYGGAILTASNYMSINTGGTCVSVYACMSLCAPKTLPNPTTIHPPRSNAAIGGVGGGSRNGSDGGGGGGLGGGESGGNSASGSVNGGGGGGGDGSWGMEALSSEMDMLALGAGGWDGYGGYGDQG